LGWPAGHPVGLIAGPVFAERPGHFCPAPSAGEAIKLAELTWEINMILAPKK